jgi:cobalt-zinc-cadmium efflux system protein
MSENHHHPKLGESSTGIGQVRQDERRRLLWVLVLTAVTMAGEIAGGIWTRSLSLLGDAFHMLTHLLAIGLSYAAIVIACRPAPPDKTYRYWRLEILAGLLNGLALLPVAGYVLWASIDRLRHPVEIEPKWTLVVGAIGLAVNLVCAKLLHAHSHHDVNLRGAFLHMIADSASSVGVLLAAGAAWAFHWTWADPLTAGAIAILIVLWCVSLVRSSGGILLEAAPHHVNLEEIRAAMKAVEGVLEVHDLHVWTITSRMYALTAHVRLREDLPVSRAEEVGRALRRVLDERWEINHATLQFEVEEGSRLDCERNLSCPTPAAGPAHPHGHAH